MSTHLVCILAIAGCEREGDPPRREPTPPIPDALVIVDVPPVPMAPAVALALGRVHSCALHEDGAVSCWGGNWYGQLGDGTKVQRDLPVRAKVADVVELAAGDDRTCARKRDRSVWCWGADGNHKPMGLAPVRVAIGDAMQITASCAVRESGVVACWDTPSAVHAITGVADAIHIATKTRNGNARDGCAVRASGRVVCWSRPDGTLVEVPGITDAVTVTLGIDFACVRRRDGGATCWGYNSEAQLGRGTMDPERGMRQQPLFAAGPVVGIADAEEVVAGHMHACARTANKRVLCWGQILGGQFLESEVHPSLYKEPVDAGIEAVKLATASGHACAILDDGKIACWGDNSGGQLGIGWSGIRTEPTRVPGIDNAIGVFAGLHVSCALRRTGRVACWGYNDPRVRELQGLVDVEQVVGDYFPCVRDRIGKVACRTFAYAKGEPITLDREAIDVTAAAGFGCAIVKGGRVRCWGSNEHATFGNNTRGVQYSTERPQPAALGIIDAVDVEADSYHACAIRATGQVACWGNKHDDDSNLKTTMLVPELVPGIADAKSLALGLLFTCILRSSGRVVCWGSNQRGQLGNGGVAMALTPSEVVGLTDAVQITAHSESACARRQNGRLVCWGRNVAGQLGDGAVRDPSDPAKEGRSRPVEVARIENAVDVSTSGEHTCAALADGAVWCWGVAAHGQVGTIAARSKKPLVIGQPP